MLGLLLLYFIGEKFYELAHEYDKHKWGFAILGIVAYYAGTFIYGIVLAIGIDIWGSGSVEDLNKFAVNIFAVPFGLLSCYGLYRLLKKSWGGGHHDDPNILDS